MNKKGAELSFNVIIIAILVIVVLVAVVAFFLGGFGKLIDVIFPQSITSVEAATTACSNSCSLAQTYETDIQKKNSGYCTKTFVLDTNGDGKADVDLDGTLKKYHCNEESGPNPLSVTCADVEDKCLR